MIQFWRKRSKTVVVHLVFWPIIAVFVIWGFERAGNPVGAAAAVVNDRTITMVDYRNALQRMMDFYNQLLQGRFDERMQKQYRVREAALQQLINNELVREQAEEMGIHVTDAEIRQKIMEIPVLQKDGRFSRENYDALLNYYHMTPVQFENDIKRSSMIDKTRKLFEETLEPSQAEVEREKKLRSTKINLEFLRLDTEALAAGAAVTTAEADKFVKDEGHLKEVKEYYDLHKPDFSQEEQVRAHHILVKAKKGNKVEEEAAMAKIKKIQEELKTASFEDLAKKYSDDPGSKIKGGDLGFFTKGRMVPEFEKAAFSSEPGKVSAPIQTDYGYHLIRVDERKGGKVTSLEDAKIDIAKKLMSKKKMDDVISNVEKKIAQDPQAALKELQKLDSKAKWQETGPFSMADESIPKLGENDDLAAAALGLTPEKPYSDRLYHFPGSLVAVKLKSMDDSSPIELSQVQEQLAKEEGRSVFIVWSGKLQEKAKIKMNPQLFSDEGPVD